MVEGGDAASSCESEGNPSTFDAVGLGSNVVRHATDDTELDETDALLAKLSIPRILPSIVDIKRALPRHVFEASVKMSMFHAAKDVVLIAVLFSAAEFFWCCHWLPTWLLVCFLPAYCFVQGTFFTAVFVIGHDAGHSSFSHHDWLNDIVGNVMHTFLLCPYYCWKLTHRHHHKNNANIDKDEVYYPVREKDCDGKHGFLLPGFGLGFGWIMYLISGYGPRAVAHFNLFAPVFRKNFLQCLVSISLVLVWIGFLWQYSLYAGFGKLLVHFLIPDFIFGSYIVIITFLHHTEEGVPWYANETWTNVRGQLSSVDRHYGWCHSIIHHIGIHQIHHLFSKIPHYHLEEATVAFRESFPQLVVVRNDRILPAFYSMFVRYARQCVISDSKKVHLYE